MSVRSGRTAFGFEPGHSTIEVGPPSRNGDMNVPIALLPGVHAAAPNITSELHDLRNRSTPPNGR